jgi:hypothetical protein
MLGHLTVYSQEEYDAWVKEEWPSQQAHQKEDGSDDRARTNG